MSNTSVSLFLNVFTDNLTILKPGMSFTENILVVMEK